MRAMRIVALSIAAALAAALLVGCTNYRPLYGSSGATEGVAVELSGITVAEQKNRAGQLVRNELMSVMRGGGSNDYMLELLPEETTRKISEPAGQKLDRYRYTLKMKYALHRAGDNTVISEGSAFSNVSYDTVEQPVSDLQAAENAKLRAAKEVSEDIRLRLAAYLSSH
jgi:LPS-assembly lipoprotein